MDNRILEIVIRAVDQASSDIKKISNNITQNLDSAKKASEAFAFGLAGAAAAAAGFIGYGAKVAGDLEASRMGFITLLGSAEEADRVLKMIKKDAASTPFELPGLITANQMLTAVTKDGEKSEKILMNVGKALSAMGKGQGELDRLIVNLQQIGAVGKASMLDIKQFAFAGIPIFEMLKEATGKTGEELENMISDGGVTFEMLTEMFNKAGESGGRFADAFKNQAGTFNQLISNMKDSFNMLMADIIRDSGLFDLLKDGISRLTEYLNAHKNEIIDFMKNGIGFIKDYGPIIAGIIIGGLVPAMIAFTGSIIAGTIALAPWLLAGAAVGALAWLLINNWTPISGFFINVWNIVSGAFSNAVTAISGKLSEMWNTAKGWIDRIVGLFKNMANSITEALKMIKFPHVNIGSGSTTIMGKKIDYPTIGVDWYENGGFVPRTGLAMVHAGEYVLSKDMLAGRQPIQAPISYNNQRNASVTLGPVYVSNEMDIETIMRRLSFELKFNSGI